MENVICKERFFEDRPDRVGLGYRLVSFSSDVRYWNRDANPAECQEFLDFLNGNSREECLRLHFIIPDSALECCSPDFRNKMQNVDSFLDYVFRGYETYNTFAGNLDYPMWVQVDKESVKVHKVYRGHRQDLGEYLKYEVSFSAQYRLSKPVGDLTCEEIANHYQYGYLFCDPREYRWCKALKAVLQYPGRIFCSYKDHFISWLPQSSEDAEKIFLGEFRHYEILGFDELVKYGGIFGPSENDRKALVNLSQKVVFYKEDTKLVAWDSFGNKLSNGWGMVKVRIPLVEKRPDLFVKNCRKGAQFMGEYAEQCRVADEVKPAEYGTGCFHYSSFVSMGSLQNRFEAMGAAVPPHLLKKPQVTPEIARTHVIEYTACCADYITAVANFVEFLMEKGDRSCDFSQKLAKHVMDCVKLDPLQYIDYEDGAVSRLARFYVNGEY